MCNLSTRSSPNIDGGEQRIDEAGNAHFVGKAGGGFAMIYGPGRTPFVEPLPPGDEGILCADIDLSIISYATQMIEVVRHYSRPALLIVVVTADPADQVALLS